MNKKTYQAPRTETVILQHVHHLLDATRGVQGNAVGGGGKGTATNGGAEACSRGGGWDDDD